MSCNRLICHVNLNRRNVKRKVGAPGGFGRARPHRGQASPPAGPGRFSVGKNKDNGLMTKSNATRVKLAMMLLAAAALSA